MHMTTTDWILLALLILFMASWIFFEWVIFRGMERGFIRQHRREIAWSLNALGLFVTVIAALVLYVYPPRFARAYTETGEQKITLINPATTEGLAYAKQWERYARVGPIMLVIGFLTQFAAAIFDAPFWARLSSATASPFMTKKGV